MIVFPPRGRGACRGGDEGQGPDLGGWTIGLGEGGPLIAYLYSPLTPVAFPPMLVHGTEA